MICATSAPRTTTIGEHPASFATATIRLTNVSPNSRLAKTPKSFPGAPQQNCSVLRGFETGG
jgi:hypothetical protein